MQEAHRCMTKSDNLRYNDNKDRSDEHKGVTILSKRTSLYKNFIRTDRSFVILLALLTAIAGEFKFIPFTGEILRFGLGSITFFLLILIRRPQSLIKAGCMTGLTVILFRLLLDTFLHQIDISLSLKSHLSAGLFYVIFATGLSVLKIEQYKTTPFLLGIIATGCEIVGNSTEQLVRSLLLDSSFLNFTEWMIICGVALLRSYFVVGLYSSIMIREQNERVREMLEVGSELYAETLYLQKSINHIEQITASSHDLYRKLTKENQLLLSKQALHIAQEIHEVKKDSQRIYAGLSKITQKEKMDGLFISQLMELVITANKKYSELLKKKISFQFSYYTDYQTEQHIPLLALFNNIIANAVESIEHQGEIIVKLYEASGDTYFMMKDSGVGISKEDKEVIFEPGYTTKYNEKGVAATGIGLSHVREIVEELKGQIEVETLNVGTVFNIKIPTKNIRK